MKLKKSGNRASKRIFSETEKAFIINNQKILSQKDMALKLNCNKKSVTNFLYNHNLSICKRFSNEEVEKVKSFYLNYDTHDKTIKDLAVEMNRAPISITRTGRELGLTNKKRKKKEKQILGIKETMIAWHKNNAHPKGFLGKNHSDKSKKILSNISNKMWTNKEHFLNSEEYKQMISDRSYNSWKTGRLNKINQYSRAKSGKREDLGFYVRSAWEANYARYLKYLIEKKIIKSFEYEPDTFYFFKIKRGTRCYTPDFKVFNLDDTFEYHEVKGWMDDKSKTKQKRMQKYYPDIKITLIERKEYTKISSLLCKVIPFWEESK